MQFKFNRAGLLVFAILCQFSVSYSQVGTLTLIPANQSPDAVSLGKFVEVPVGLYNGTPNISIPLYNFPVHNLTIPISLSYNASGIKVKDIAGQVGTGFSLNAGGMITRVVRGYPDHYNIRGEDYYSNFDTLKNQRILNAHFNGSLEGGFNTMDTYHALLSVPGVRAEGANSDYPFYYWGRPLDTEMDLFYFNFLGYAGSFTFSNQGEAIILSGPKDLKIEYTYGKYKITDGEGIEFYFNDREFGFMNYSITSESMYTTSWNLSKIYLPRYKATVDFQYRTYKNEHLYPKDLFRNYPNAFFNTSFRLLWGNLSTNHNGQIVGPPCSLYESQSSLNYPYLYSSALLISEISWNDNKISFFGDTTRTDIYKYKLDSIKVKCADQVVSNIRLEYSYFNAASTNMAQKRLKLIDVHVNDARFRFDYIDSLWGRGVPSINSTGQDIWGYYNGEDDEDVMPRYKLFDYSIFYGDVSRYTVRSSSVPKNPDFRWAQLGTLRSITYPTGGQSLFEFEGNNYSKVGFLSPLQTVESDPYTQMKLDSVRFKSAAVYTRPRETSYSQTVQREFVVHTDQVTEVNFKLGMSYHQVSYAAYMDTLNAWWSMATASILRYNDTTKVFEPVWSHTIMPKDSIGNPAVYEYNDVRHKGLVEAVRSVPLSQGRYRIEIFLNGWYQEGTVNVRTVFPFKKYPGIYNAAGLRLRKLEFVSNTDADTSFIKHYKYTKDSISSGVLESPFGLISRSHLYGAYHNLGGGVGYQNNCSYLNFNAEPLIPLGNAKGGVVGYSEVIEIREDGAKTVHHFTTGADGYYYFSDVFFEHYSFFAFRSGLQFDNSWKRGIPVQVDYYNTTGSLVKQEFSKYFFMDNEYYKKSVSMILDDVILYPSGSNNLGSYSKRENFYIRSSGHPLKYQDSTVLFTSNGMINEVTDYEYLYAAYPHVKPIKITKHNSAGGYTITRLKYPQDYTLTGSNPANPAAKIIKKLISNNILSPAIEQYQQKSDPDGNNVRTISGQYIKFDTTGILVDSVFSLDLDKPLIGYNEIIIDSIKTIQDSRYKAKIIFSKYDDFGNVSEQSKANDVKEVLLWGYKNQYPVARVTGSNYNTVSALVDLNILNNPTSETQLLTELQKIRTHFANSQIQVFTYAYAPLKGITTEVDPRGRKTYYLYDSQGRLTQVKNHEGEILKIIKYSYAP